MDFSQLWDSAGGQFGLGSLLVNNPEVVAQGAAAAGIPPPPLNAGVPDVGASLNPQVQAGPANPNGPMVAGPQAPMMQPPAAPQQPPGSNILSTLRGVTPPTAPTVPGLVNMAPPRPTGNAKSGQLMALLQALNLGGGAQAPGLKLPSTLGAALGGR